MEKKLRKVDILSLGCSKNLVDSERVMKILADGGFEVRHNPEIPDCDHLIINTCGFIDDAKEESINTILHCIKLKKQGKIGQITVMGCLSERYLDQLKPILPEVDRWYGKFDWQSIARDMAISNPAVAKWDRVITTPRHHAYIKISEGCNRFCAFCAIPLITGRHKSRPMEEILQEVSNLTNRGVTEFNVIAQDLSSYGTDLYGQQKLATLIDSMAGIPGVKRIRLHYAYPAQFPYDILPVMAKHSNVCKYLDIALQHINNRVLKNMRRHIDAQETRQLLARIRREVPGIHIRTTLMVGFPGEGPKAFEELKEFVKEQRFERMGAFAYSPEEGTYGYEKFHTTIPSKVKQQRLNELMEIQEQISLELNQEKIDTVMEVVVDGRDEGMYVARTEFDSPEVDPEVRIPVDSCKEPLVPGQYLKVRITDAFPFELIAEPEE